MVRLMGARLITISEVKQKDALKSELMKGWTGGDVISATPKYGHPVDFKPNGTIVLVGNELPEIEFEDDAMWGRVMIVPFDVSCPPERQDKKLMEKFDLEAVLAWMVEGHKRYQVLDGLRPPKECQLKKTKHKEDMDPLAEFWDEQVQVVGLGGPEPPFVTTAELYHHYRNYCDGLGIKNKPPCTKKAVTRYANRQAAVSGDILRREGNSLQRGWLGIIAKAKEVGE